MWMMSPPPDDLPQPHPPVWMPRTTMPVSLGRLRMQGLTIEGPGGKRNKGPGIKHIVNFDRDEDYQHDCPVWKHGSSYPRDTVQVPDLEFKPEPPSKRSDRLLFDPTRVQSSEAFLG